MPLLQGIWKYDNLNPKLSTALIAVTPWVKTKVWPSRKMAPLAIALMPWPHGVSFSSCNMIKTFQIEGMIALITEIDLIFS